MGLFDLPAEVLKHILSYLNPLSVAAVRVTCRGLRAVLETNSTRVVISFQGWYTATVRVSPSVLQAMHAFYRLLDEEQCGMDANRATGSSDRLHRSDSSEAVYAARRNVQQTRLLMDVAAEVEALKIEEEWFNLAKKVENLPIKPHNVLAQMRQLRALELEDFLDAAISWELCAMPHLTSLKYRGLCSRGVFQELCSTVALSRLDFGDQLWGPSVDGYPDPLRYHGYQADVFDFQDMVGKLVAGKTSALQELHLPLPSPHAGLLSRLTALTGLTALGLHVLGAPVLAPLAALTGLQSFQLRVAGEDGVRLDSLSLLTALAGLTRLDLGTHGRWPGGVGIGPPAASILSSLTALRVLRCGLLSSQGPPADGDPLPVELRFLRAATALEVLDLGLGAPVWCLGEAQVSAALEAVSALSSLKKVRIRLNGFPPPFFAPLAPFAAASSVESLVYEIGGAMLPRSEDDAAHARACLKALTQLRSLSFEGEGCFVPHCADLLAGLPSACLTSLSVKVDTEPDAALMQQISRFHDLQDLVLDSPPVRSELLSQLFGLRSLTHLVLLEKGDVDRQQLRRRRWLAGY